MTALRKGCLCEQFFHHPAVDVGQAEIAAGVAVGELFVVEAQQVQDRRVQIVDVDVVLDGREAELVGGAVDVAALHAAAGQPHREAVVIVVAAVDLAGIRPGCGSSTVGVRPNSPPQITSVSSSMPALLEIGRAARAIGLVAFAWPAGDD